MLHFNPENFDTNSYIVDKKLLDPIPTPDPAAFPKDDYIPEGAHLLEGLSDDWGCNLDFQRTVYAERDGRKLELNILIPTIPQPGHEDDRYPCVAYVQGSAFHEQWLFDNLIRHVRLASLGYVVAIVQYRPSEVAPFPAQMQDAKTAIRFLRKNAKQYHIDSEHIAVAGDSSGAHTALMVGITGDDEPDTELYGEYSAKVNCIVDCYGPTVFSLMNYDKSSQNHWEADSPEGFEIGQKNILENMEEAAKTIPMNYLSRDRETPPMLVINGNRDMLVPFRQSVYLYEYMKSLEKDIEYYVIDNGNHGFNGWNNDTVLNIVAEFLNKHI